MTNYLCRIIAVAIVTSAATIGDADDLGYRDISCFGGPNVAPMAAKSPVAAKRPVVLGNGAGLFEIGKLLAQDDFEDLDNFPCSRLIAASMLHSSLLFRPLCCSSSRSHQAQLFKWGHLLPFCCVPQRLSQYG